MIIEIIRVLPCFFFHEQGLVRRTIDILGMVSVLHIVDVCEYDMGIVKLHRKECLSEVMI